MSRRSIIAFAGLAVLLAAAVAGRLLAGQDLATFATAEMRASVLEIRAMQVLQGLIVGAALGAGGVLLQALLRNPLASPDLLGLSAGAGLAVMLAVFVATLVARQAAMESPAPAAPAADVTADAPARGPTDAALTTGDSARSAAPGYLHSTWQAGPALIGSLAALGLVYSLSRRRGMVDPPTLVLIGVMVSILCGAGVTLILSLMPQASMRPLLGALSEFAPLPLIVAAGAVTVLGVAIGAWAGPAMDAASLSDDEAISVGVPLARLRLLLFIVSGVMTAGAVVIAGPIGFVGLVCPHAVRLTAGPRHRPLVLGAAIAGAVLIIGADALVSAFKLPTTGRIPLGVVTALIGGPVFIWLLRRSWVAS